MKTKTATQKTKKRVQKTAPKEESSSRLIDAKIEKLGGWRAEILARMRALILEADPAIVEGVKWRKPSNPAGVPVWEHDGLICTGETYKDKVKLTFARGAASSTRARAAMSAARSIFAKAMRLTRAPSRRW